MEPIYQETMKKWISNKMDKFLMREINLVINLKTLKIKR